MAHVNVLNRILRSIDSTQENRRKMKPSEWGEAEEGGDLEDLDDRRIYLREKSLLRQEISQQNNPPVKPLKPPKPAHFQLLNRERVAQKLELFRSESQEMTYRVLEATSYLHEQQQQREQPAERSHQQDEGIYLADPLTRHELLNRKLSRQWWTSHSQLPTVPPQAVLDNPLDTEQYDLCLQHFSYFFHENCHFSRRRSLDLARYFIQLGHCNEMRLREMIERYSIDWLYDLLSNESPEVANHLISQEIEMISNGLQKKTDNESLQSERWSTRMEISDDEWDDRLMKLTAEKELQSTASDLLSSIQKQFSHLQQDLQQIDNTSIGKEEMKIRPEESSENILSVYERTLQNLIPSIEVPLSPVSSSESRSLNSPDSKTLEAIYSVDQKLSVICTGIYSLYYQLNSMDLHINGIQSELLKHENMLTSLLTEEYRVPKYAIIVPVEEISLQSFHSVSFSFPISATDIE
jgi:hypothetical protein